MTVMYFVSPREGGDLGPQALRMEPETPAFAGAQ